MENFTIDGLAAQLEQAKASAADPQQEVARVLKATIAAHGPERIIEVLEAAVPAGASVGELIFYRSAELTLLYGRIPAHFRSAIHDHTVFACIAQLTGAETSVVYEPDASGEALVVRETVTSGPGEVTMLAPDAIHHIENPTDEVACALHVYGGDFSALAEHRSLWSHDHVRHGFSFEKLAFHSVVAMKKTGNASGLRAFAKAMPAVEALIESVP